MMRRLWFLCGLLGAGPLWAEQTAPDYYVESLFAVTTAEQLANFCVSTGFDADAANALATATLQRLATDGVQGDAILELTGVTEGVGGLQSAFMVNHGLAEPTAATICAAAKAEIERGSVIGSLLVEIE